MAMDRTTRKPLRSKTFAVAVPSPWHDDEFVITYTGVEAEAKMLHEGYKQRGADSTLMVGTITWEDVEDVIDNVIVLPVRDNPLDPDHEPWPTAAAYL